jgi:cbb3-type cytochrome oxidase maturation protein
MSVIFLLILISLLVATCFLGLFLWAVKSGQYDDDYGPAVRILFDDYEELEEQEKTETQNCNNDGTNHN